MIDTIINLLGIDAGYEFVVIWICGFIIILGIYSLFTLVYYLLKRVGGL